MRQRVGRRRGEPTDEQRLFSGVDFVDPGELALHGAEHNERQRGKSDLICKSSEVLDSEAEAQKLNTMLCSQDHLQLDGSKAMESATFRKWLAERGCGFDQHGHEKRGEG